VRRDDGAHLEGHNLPPIDDEPDGDLVVRAKEAIDLDRISRAVREILLAVGEDPERDGLRETPDRVARMYAELFSCLHDYPRRHLKKFFSEQYDEVVLVLDGEGVAHAGGSDRALAAGTSVHLPLSGRQREIVTSFMIWHTSAMLSSIKTSLPACARRKGQVPPRCSSGGTR